MPMWPAPNQALGACAAAPMPGRMPCQVQSLISRLLLQFQELVIGGVFWTKNDNQTIQVAAPSSFG